MPYPPKPVVPFYTINPSAGTLTVLLQDLPGQSPPGSYTIANGVVTYALTNVPPELGLP